MSEIGPNYFNSASKRRLDVVGGFTIATLAAAPSVVVAGLTALEHGPRNLLFHQLRRRNREEEFTIAKFKTIKGSINETTPQQVPSLLAAYLAKNAAAFDEWLAQTDLDELWRGAALEAAHQHAIISAQSSRLGNFLRVAGLDEAPQIVSILKGESSLTGPRAQTDAVLETRLRAAPGLFDEWMTGFYEPYKKGWVSPGSNWYHAEVPDGSLEPKEIIVGVMERDLAWVESADLAADLRLLAEVPIDLVQGLKHHLLRSRAQRTIESV